MKYRNMSRLILSHLSFMLMPFAWLTDANMLKGRSVTSDYQQIGRRIYNSKNET